MANDTSNQKLRGSEKLLSAWKNRSLTEESVREIAKNMDQSPAHVIGAKVVGGNNATGVQLSLAYYGDDVPTCGNDILLWLKWHRVHGGDVHPPKIIIDGIPFPDVLRMQLDFGDVTGKLTDVQHLGNLAGQLNRMGNIGG
ncbi:hypothetical protein AAKU64_003439 [Undibacterium sp. GrIS 1.8]|uniref:hypothetical protein n=1 Tax=unclassified Undibacterium TaxID=2630295 RepID=UPI0033930D11